MNEMTCAAAGSLTILDRLAADARYWRDNMWHSGLELGRVLTEARKLVPHGEWGKWLQENCDTSVRGAQQMMQIYEKFGGKASFESIDKSKLIKMLALPAGSEEAFVAENDVQNMTAREVEKAVKQAQKNAAAEIPEEVADKLLAQQREIDLLTGANRDLVGRNSDLTRTNREMQQAIDDSSAVIDELQQQFDSMQSELTTLKSMEAKGDVERNPRNELTEETFCAAVRQFMGVCSTMPQMGKRFATMDSTQRLGFEEGLITMENWVKGARRALDMICGEVLGA